MEYDEKYVSKRKKKKKNFKCIYVQIFYAFLKLKLLLETATTNTATTTSITMITTTDITTTKYMLKSFCFVMWFFAAKLYGRQL